MTSEEYKVDWAETNLRPLLTRGSPLTRTSLQLKYGNYFDAERLEPWTDLEKRQVAALAEVYKVETLRPSLLRIHLTEKFELESLFAEKERLVRLELIGLICNAKNLHLLGVYMVGAQVCLIGKAVATGDLNIGNIKRLVGRGNSELTDEIMGVGYLDLSREVDGCPRAHTPIGVRPQGEGYGTSLHVGLACVAELWGNSCISLAPENGIAAKLSIVDFVQQGLVLWLANSDEQHAELIAEAYEEFVDRFKRLNPGTDDPKILDLLREILIAGKISNDDLARWDATHGRGGRGTGFLFDEDDMFGGGRESLNLARGDESAQLRARGQPVPRTFAQMPLPGSLAPNRRRAPADPELRALVEPWSDDDS